jgi:hypothetical protein
VPLDRDAVDKTAGEHIKQVQQTRTVSEQEKLAIRKMHERMAKKANGKTGR